MSSSFLRQLSSPASLEYLPSSNTLLLLGTVLFISQYQHVHATNHNSHESTVRLLLDRSADVNIQANHSCTALIIAISQRKESTVRLLSEYGADKDLKTALATHQTEKVFSKAS